MRTRLAAISTGPGGTALASRFTMRKGVKKGT